MGGKITLTSFGRSQLVFSSSQRLSGLGHKCFLVCGYSVGIRRPRLVDFRPLNSIGRRRDRCSNCGGADEGGFRRRLRLSISHLPFHLPPSVPPPPPLPPPPCPDLLARPPLCPPATVPARAFPCSLSGCHCQPVGHRRPNRAGNRIFFLAAPKARSIAQPMSPSASQIGERADGQQHGSNHPHQTIEPGSATDRAEDSGNPGLA